MTHDIIGTKIAEHQARIDTLTASLQQAQNEILQRQGAIIALQDLLAEPALEAVPDAEPAAEVA